MSSPDSSSHQHGYYTTTTGLKKVAPYWYPYTTMAKGRWLGRELLEVVSTEFRDRSMEYYRYALESGVTTINGQVAKPDTIVRNGDRIENVVHRHEPPVSSRPVKITLHDKERDFIVIDKPGSIPVHATGRYYKNSLIEILQDEFGFEKVYPVNRLDRLTSGLMILPLNAKLANEMANEFKAGTIRKEYIARVKGKFPEGPITCEQPLLTVDRQMGLNIVHPEGKEAKTIFTLMMHYDENTDTSVVHCQPFTGRSHQLRVHLQYLGYPIANDPIYSETKIWGEKLGKGGVDINPSDERTAPVIPAQFQTSHNPESLADKPTTNECQDDTQSSSFKPKLLPRETGHDIGMGSPVPLSAEAVGVISRLRNMKDEDEDWSRWRDVVFLAKGALNPTGIKVGPPPPQNKRKRGGPARAKEYEQQRKTEEKVSISSTHTEDVHHPIVESVELEEVVTPTSSVQQHTTEEAMARLKIIDDPDAKETNPSEHLEEMRYCPECYLPMHPDPKPERLYIFLHALRYTTSLGKFETEMPEWATPGWEWDRS
ncbi:pseudouridine synthase [Abortiporus biennis]|nr:pseudouridine synthase [Abortiporus biennis]